MENKITEFLKSKMPDAKNVQISELWKSTEGFSYQTYTFRADWTEKGKKVSKKLVIRTEPEEGLVPPYDVRPQYFAQEALAGSNVPVPHVFWLEMDPHVTGKPFYMMDWIEGDVPIPWGFLADEKYKNPVIRKQMGDHFIEVLANIHNFDWKAKGLDKHLPVPELGRACATERIQKWEGLLKKYRIEPEPVMAEALAYLKANIPETTKLCLTHGDYRVGNFIWRDGRIRAMLDWESVEIGDPLMDLGYATQLHWSPDDHSKFFNIVEQDYFFEKYEELTGVKVDPECFRFWRVMEIYRNITILIIGSRVIMDRTSKDIRLMMFSVLPFPMYLDLLNQLL